MKIIITFLKNLNRIQNPYTKTFNMKKKIQRIGLKSYLSYDRFIEFKINILFVGLNISGSIS